LFLVYISPGFATPLTYRQTDVLHFSKQFIGNLGTVEGVMGLIGAALYAVLCRRVKLRWLLVISIATNAAGFLLFLIYTRDTAILVHAVSGFVGVVAELALMDMAVRSTPPGCE